MNRAILFTICLICLAATSMADTKAAQKLRGLGSELEATTNTKWRISYDYKRSCAKALDGKYSTGTAVTDNTVAEELISGFLQTYSQLLNIKSADLSDPEVTFNQVRDYYWVDHMQVYRAVPVETGSVRSAISADGVILWVRNSFYPNINVETTPTINAAEAVTMARALVIDPTEDATNPVVELVIFPVEGDDEMIYHLCQKVKFFRLTYFIDAHSGELVTTGANFIDDVIHSGTIRGNTYPVNNPLGAATMTPLKYVGVFFFDDVKDTSYLVSADSLGVYSVELETMATDMHTWLGSYITMVVSEEDRTTEHDFTYATPGDEHHDHDYITDFGYQTNVFSNITQTFKDFNEELGHWSNSVYVYADWVDTATALGKTNGSTIWIKTDVGRYSSTTKHEFTHCVVYKVVGGFIQGTGNTKPFKCMDEAFASYFPCDFNGSHIYLQPGSSYDLTTSSGAMTIRDLDSNSVIDEKDHGYYWNRFAVAAAWWELRGTGVLGRDYTNYLVWESLLKHEGRHPRDFFNQILIADDDDEDSKTGTPNLEAISTAYHNHGMNYYPLVSSVEVGGAPRNSFLEKTKVYCSGERFPTNQDVRIYVVDHIEDWTVTEELDDVSGAVEIVAIGSDGLLPVTEIWDIPEGRTGYFDIVVDVDNDGFYNFEFDGIIDAGDGLQEPGFVISCCTGATMGNIDCKGIIDIGDVTTMIQKLFITLTEYCCFEEADLDYSDIIDIGDLTILVRNLFITLEDFLVCPEY